MNFSSDVILKGSNWRVASDKLTAFFNSQPNYEMYYLAISIGIVYDKQMDSAGEEDEELGNLYVPRSVLFGHNTDLDFMFQTAILTSKLVDFSDKDRMKLAFDNNTDIQFNKIEFLTKFANFGISKLIEKLSDVEIETMDNLRQFVTSSIEGHNYELEKNTEEDLNEIFSDFDFLE